jgi:hypothetical protein
MRWRVLAFLALAVAFAWLGRDGVREGTRFRKSTAISPIEDKKPKSNCFEQELERQGMFVVKDRTKEAEERRALEHKMTVEMLLDSTVISRESRRSPPEPICSE